jgi:hypothetical protein
MNNIKIVKNIPIPTKTRGRDAIYDFDIMDVGDSFFVEGDSKIQISVLTCARRKKPKQFVTKKEVCGSKNGYRCWRVK